MKEEKIEKGTLGKQSKNQIISSEKKKKLMKRLARIKLNNSRPNNSFFDISAFYEAKIRKLKLNNVSLAKALSDQKQVSQTWYETVVTLKEELHDTQESLLRLHYQVKENGDYEHIIQESVERRIRSIAEPLDASISESLKNVYSLVENLTTVKQLLSSTLSFNSKEKLNFSRNSSHSSHGSRPPLSQNSKSPRKNVVHPMVEGHVLQPATIHIPRMTLEEKRRYRLQEQAESRMEVIGEQSVAEQEDSSSTSDNDDPASDNQNMEENLEFNMEVSRFNSCLNEDPSGLESEISTPEHIQVPLQSESPYESKCDLPSSDDSISEGALNCAQVSENVSLQSENPYASKCDIPSSEDSISEETFKSVPVKQIVALKSEDSNGSKCDLPSSEDSISEETLKSKQMSQTAAHVCEEDPLEGASWMHLKKKSIKSKSKPRNSNVRTSGMHFALDTSSDSEEEDSMEIPMTKIRHGKIKGSSRKRPSRTKSSKVSISHLDLLDSKVSKRCKKSRSSSVVAERNSKETSDLVDDYKEHKSPTLASFIIKDSDTDMPENEIQDLKTCLNKSNGRPDEVENKPNLSISSPRSEQNLNPVVNLTCISNSPMEITECIPKEMLKKLGRITEQSSDDSARLITKVDENIDSKCDNQNNSNAIQQSKESEHLQSRKSVSQESKKGNKYFKTALQGNESIDVVSKKKTESCVYDISLMDASQIGPNLTSVGKENVPPSSNDVQLKIKDISIIVKDILKSPYPKLDSESNPPFYGFPNEDKESDNLNKLKKSASVKNKGKSKKTNESSLRKVSKNPKFYSDNYSITIYSSPSATDEDDVWSPSKNASKRKSKQTKKGINSRKKLKHQPEEKSEKHVASSSSCSTTNETCKVEPKTKATNFNTNNTDNMKLQINPLCEIPMDSNSLGPVSSEIFKDVNDIIRKHIKKEIEHIPSFESCEVIEINSDDDGDPLAISNIDLFSLGRRRAALKVQSLKEPALNTKLRRNCPKKTVKKAPKKKSAKT